MHYWVCNIHLTIIAQKWGNENSTTQEICFYTLLELSQCKPKADSGKLTQANTRAIISKKTKTTIKKPSNIGKIIKEINIHSMQNREQRRK